MLVKGITFCNEAFKRKICVWFVAVVTGISQGKKDVNNHTYRCTKVISAASKWKELVGESMELKNLYTTVCPCVLSNLLSKRNKFEGALNHVSILSATGGIMSVTEKALNVLL